MTRVVLQARVESTRLPGKTLLPLAGMPAAVLAARRAASRRDHVVAAIADEPLAPLLERAFEAAGIDVCRGSLYDVLARFETAIADVPDDAVVVRLTADNPLPDGDLIREVVTAVEREGDVYAEIAWPAAGLPYGLGVEACRAGALREAAARATDRYDREHVTPWVVRNRPTIAVVPTVKLGRDCAALRCTLDNFDDYQRLSLLFSSADVAQAPWHELVAQLAEDSPSGLVPQVIDNGLPASRVILGTAQLGSAYGVANSAGDPGDEGAAAIVAAAFSHGITVFDTAPGYGRSEERLGATLAGALRGRGRVMTKLDHTVVETIGNGDGRAAVDASVFRSMARLRSSRLDTLLLHRWSQRHAAGGAIWHRLVQLRDEELVGRLGVSVLEPREALEALVDEDVAVIQLPLNLLDDRWREAGVPEAAGSRPDVVLHARSVFLQGLLVSPVELWPALPGVDPAGIVKVLDDAASDGGFATRAELCLAYVLDQTWIDAAIVGADDAEQVAEIARYAGPTTPREAVDWPAIRSRLRPQPDHLLDPWRWPVS